MSERRLKLGHRKEYKRKSKHTRNPSYYPRHLTKVTLADFDADFNLRVSKEVAAQRGYGRKPILILTPMEQTLTFIDRGC